MNAEDAESALVDSELVACLQAPIMDIKEIRQACLEAEIPVLLGRDDACCGAGGGGCGCGPKLRLLARPEDAPRVARLMQMRWRELALREGTIDDDHPVVTAGAGDADPPCPACGVSAPLAGGACSDCGLQLE
jgi:hypothetical protein